jgi:anti-sigma factor RsiW
MGLDAAMLKCRYTRARIPAFINQELPVITRRYVVRHLDECPRCRKDYEQQRTLQQQLQRELPLLGQPEKTSLNRIRSKVLAELMPQPAAPVRVPQRPLYMYGMVVTALAVLLLLPLSAAGSAVRAAVPEHPSPRRGLDISTPSVAAAVTKPTRIAAAYVVQTEPGNTDTPEILDNTPATPEPVVMNTES